MQGRDLQLLVGAVFLSALGDWLALTALALHLEETTDSGIAVAVLFIALWSPFVVFAGPAGLVVDRFDARRVIVLASLAQAAIAAALAFTGALVPSGRGAAAQDRVDGLPFRRSHLVSLARAGRECLNGMRVG